MAEVLLLLDHSSVALPNFSPAAIEIASSGGKGRFRRSLLIYLNAPAWLFTYPQVAILHFRTAVKDFLRALVERGVFLDAEVITHNIQSYICHMSNWGNVARSVPCRFDSVLLGQDRNFPGRAEAARLRYVHADVVDETTLDQWLPFVRAIEELAHGDRCCAVLPDLLEVTQVLGRQRIFKEKHVVLFRLFAELHCE